MSDDQPNPMADRTRDGNGRFDRDPDTAQRDAEAARLRSRGLTYRQIGEQLGMSKSSAHEAVQRALHDTLAEPAADVRQLELDRLDDMWQAVVKVLEAKHFTVSQGKVVYLGEEPLEDDAPVLAAVDRLLKIQERRAKLLGLDAPSKQEIGGQLTYEIVGVQLDNL